MLKVKTVFTFKEGVWLRSFMEFIIFCSLFGVRYIAVLTSQRCMEITFMINTIFYMCIIFLLKLQKVSEDKLSQINERSQVSVSVFNNSRSMGSLNFKNYKSLRVDCFNHLIS